MVCHLCLMNCLISSIINGMSAFSCELFDQSHSLPAKRRLQSLSSMFVETEDDCEAVADLRRRIAEVQADLQVRSWQDNQLHPTCTRVASGVLAMRQMDLPTSAGSFGSIHYKTLLEVSVWLKILFAYMICTKDKTTHLAS